MFLVTLNPGAVVTFVAELASPKLPQVYLWEPEAYKDTVNSYTLFRGIVIGIAGLLALFLTILFVVKGTSMFPATAALAWAVLAYICVDFGFLNKVIEIIARQRADMARRHRGRRWRRPSWCSCSPISTSTDGTAISAMARWSGCSAWS